MGFAALREKLYRYRGIVSIPFLAGIFTVIALIAVDPTDYPNSDFFSFWLSGRMAVAGQNPYDATLWIEAHHQYGANWISDAKFLYPLPLSLFFAPFGFLALYEAFIAWAIFSQFMIFFSVALLLRSYPASLAKHFILPFFVTIAVFRPTIITLHNGQVTALLLLTIVFTLYFWERGEWWQGSIFLPILALKPNLGGPIILLLVYYLLHRKQVTSLLAAVISGLGLLLVGLVQNPNWVVEFWSVGNTKLSETFGFSPTVWGVSAFFCRYERSCTLLSGGVISLLIFIGLTFLITRKGNVLSPTLFASIVIPMVLLLTPYTWPYDQLLLLIPVITVTLGLARAGYRFLPIALIFVALDALAFIMLIISAALEREYWNAIIPLSIFFLVVWYLFARKSASLDTQSNLA